MLKLLVLLDALLLMLLLQMMRSDMSLAADDACMHAAVAKQNANCCADTDAPFVVPATCSSHGPCNDIVVLACGNKGFI